MSGCSLVAPGLPSQLNGVTPTFSYNPSNPNYFGVQVTYLSGSSTCNYPTGTATFTPYLYSGKATATCDFNTAGDYSQVVCSNVPVTAFNNGAYTIGYSGVKGISSNRSPIPFTFTMGTSPAANTVTVVTSTAATTTSTTTAAAAAAATTTQTSYFSTVTQTNTVSSNVVVTDSQTKYVSSCTPKVPAPDPSSPPKPSSTPAVSSSSFSKGASSIPSASSSISTPGASSAPEVSSPKPSLSPSSSALPSSRPYPSFPSSIACPNANGTIYSTSNGNYIIECYVDRSDHDLESVQASSFYACISQCVSTAGCVDVSYASSANTCYLKNGQGNVNSNNGIWGAALYPYSASIPSATTTATAPTSTSTGPVPSCPADDKTYYYSGGNVFYIECYTDRSVSPSLPPYVIPD
jgi:hypothetical protein